MMDVIGYDNGEGLAEVDTYGTASGTGDYAQVGYHEVVTDDEYEYEDIGTTDADVDWEGGSCDYPTYDNTVDGGSYSMSAGKYSRNFSATVSDDYDTSFADRPIYELYGGSDTTFAPLANNKYSTCPDSTYIPGLFTGAVTYVNGSNQYTDRVGIVSTYVLPVINGLAASPCGFTAYQQMWMQCTDGPDYNYATNYIYVGVEMYPSAGYGSDEIDRGDGEFTVNFPDI